MSEQNELSTKVQRAEWIGVVSSPSSSNSLTVDLIEGAFERGLVGNFCVIEFRQDGKPTYPIGQILSTKLENPFIERHSIRKITSTRGHAPPLTAQHDVRIMDVMLGSTYCFDNGRILPATVGSIPQSGTKIFQLNQEIVDEIVRGQTNISYVGKIYNTQIYLPMFFKHFGKGSDGLGEGYHIGIFGKTGSGKSYLARMILLHYAKFPQMSILTLDPVGEYSQEMRNNGKLAELLGRTNRTTEVRKVSDITFSSQTTFCRILARSNFIYELGVRGEWIENALNLIETFLISPSNQPRLLHGVSTVAGNFPINHQVAFDELMNFIQQNIDQIYVSRDPQQRVLANITNRRQSLYNIWRLVANLFVTTPQKIGVDDLIQRICTQKHAVFVDLSELATAGIFWSPEVMAIVLDELFGKLRTIAESLYHRPGQELINLLVVVDEAHRFIPSERPTDEDFRALKKTLETSARETRKYGLGWLFISTSVAGLESEVLKQMRVYFFGYGLSWGGELRALRELIGEQRYLDLYQSFRDPTTLLTMGGKQYPFMVHGPISPLSISGAPMFFNVIDYYTEFPDIYQHAGAIAKD